MPIDRKIIAAIDLGSSKVTAALGQKETDGSITLLAVEQRPSSAFIRKGRIHNIPKTESIINELKETLQKRSHMKINCAYVGIGGMGLRSESNQCKKLFDERRLVSEEDIEEINKENINNHSADRIVLQSIPQQFLLGHIKTLEPIGVQADNVEGVFLNIHTKREMKENIENCFNECHIDIAGLPITLLAQAQQMLTEAQKRSGCVLVDMGAETTTVGIFKNNLLRHLAVIPLGGKNITKDITSLQIEENEAEQLKLKFGKAYSEEDPSQHAPIRLQVGESVPYKEFCGLVEARQEEIIANVAQQIEISGFDKSQLIGGIVITGGASKMSGIETAFEKYSGFDKDKIVIVKPLKVVYKEKGGNHQNTEGELNSIISLLLQGTQNCCSDENDPQLKAKEEALRIKAEQEEILRKREEEERKREEEEENERKRIKEAEERKKRKKGRKIKSFFNKALQACANIVSDNEN